MLITYEPIYSVTSFHLRFLNKLLEKNLFDNVPSIGSLEENSLTLARMRRNIGFGHTDLLNIITYILGPLLVVTILASLLKWCSNTCWMPQSIERVINAFNSLVKWNLVLRYFMQIYLTYILSLLLVLKEQDFSFEKSIPVRGFLWALSFGIITFFPFISYAIMLNQ